MNDAHRINLRGPWGFRRVQGDGLPSDGRVKMPISWRAAFGEAAGTVAFDRVFHLPTNLEPGQRLDLVFPRVEGAGRVELNGRELGEMPEANNPVRFDVTDRLTFQNRLTVELTFDPAASSEDGGLVEVVRLEIFEPSGTV